MQARSQAASPSTPHWTMQTQARHDADNPCCTYRWLRHSSIHDRIVRRYPECCLRTWEPCRSFDRHSVAYRNFWNRRRTVRCFVQWRPRTLQERSCSDKWYRAHLRSSVRRHTVRSAALHRPHSVKPCIEPSNARPEYPNLQRRHRILHRHLARRRRTQRGHTSSGNVSLGYWHCARHHHIVLRERDR